VAVSVGNYGASLGDGAEFRGRYGISDEDLAAFHRKRLQVRACISVLLLLPLSLFFLMEAFFFSS